MRGADPRQHDCGHRKRLRWRIERATDSALDDYELLELLLTYAIPRCDTKPIAKALLTRFGDMAGVFGAERCQMQEVAGIGPRAAGLMALVVPLAARAWTVTKENRITLSSPEESGSYFRARLRHLREEQVHAAFVNSRNAVTAVECLQEGSVDHSFIYPRKVLQRALLHKSSGFILAHNHPSGCATPSQEDLQFTANLSRAARIVGVRFLDHLVIGAKETYSFRHHGLLTDS